MTWWQALIVALATGIVGTILGAQLQARRERKAAVRTAAIEEILAFAESGQGWLERVESAIDARDSIMSVDEEEAAVKDAEAALVEARRLLARMLPVVGPTSSLGREGVSIVGLLEAAVAEIRVWPPWEREDYDPGTDDLGDMTQEERDALQAAVDEDDWAGSIGEATMWLEWAREGLARFSSSAASHIDPTIREGARTAWKGSRGAND